MDNILLTSYFKEVASLLPTFLNTELAGKKVCFIPTASIPEPVNFYVNDGREALEAYGLEVMELEILTASSEEIVQKITEADVIYVTGGNTFFLLDAFRKRGVDALIIQQIHSGKPYIGESAGSIILSADIAYATIMDSPEAAPDLNKDYEALAITEFSIVPHATNMPFKDMVKETVQTYSNAYQLTIISNHQAIMKIGDEVTLYSVE